MTDAEALADALKLDMKAWFTPTAADYFGNVSKAVIIDAMREIKGDTAPAWAKMKKPELAAFAEKQVEGADRSALFRKSIRRDGRLREELGLDRRPSNTTLFSAGGG